MTFTDAELDALCGSLEELTGTYGIGDNAAAAITYLRAQLAERDDIGAAVMRERAADHIRGLHRVTLMTPDQNAALQIAADGIDRCPLPTHAGLLVHAMTLPEIKALVDAVKVTQDTLCEGFCSDFPSGYTSVEIERDCGGCKSRAALAALGVDTK